MAAMAAPWHGRESCRRLPVGGASRTCDASGIPKPRSRTVRISGIPEAARPCQAGVSL